MSVRIGVRACLRQLQLVAVRCNVRSAPVAASFSSLQLVAAVPRGLLIPRLKVRVLHGPSAKCLFVTLLKRAGLGGRSERPLGRPHLVESEIEAVGSSAAQPAALKVRGALSERSVHGSLASGVAS